MRLPRCFSRARRASAAEASGSTETRKKRHNLRSLLTRSWREGSTILGLVLAGIGVMLLSPEIAARIVGRLQSVRAIFGAAGDAAASIVALYLIWLRQKENKDAR